MPSSRLQLIAALALAVVLPAKGDFSGPYALTPPAPGVFSGAGLATCCGAWTVVGIGGTVTTLDSPGRLELQVPSGSLVSLALRFQTVAAGDGVVQFDPSVVNVSNGGTVSWFLHPVGGVDTFHSLDRTLPGTVSFNLHAGDAFGFRLTSGTDAVPNPEIRTIDLTVQNFFAPVPEPGVLALLGLGAALVVVRFWCRR